MLSNFGTRRRNNKGTSRRDIKQIGAVTTGADNIHHVI